MTLGDGFPAASGTVDSTELRKALAGLILRDTSGNARAGVFPRHTSALVTSKASMAVDVAAFEGVTVRGGGPIFMANDGTVTVSIDAAPGSNSRIDVVYFKQNESAAPYSDANNSPVIGVAKGTANAIPVKPTIPAGASELATILIPSGVSATNAGGVVITQTFQYTALTGALLWVRNSTERGALPTLPDGTRAFQLDTKVTYRLNGSTWVEWESDWISWSTAPTNLAVGTGGSASSLQRYKYVGGRIYVDFKFVLGTSGASMGTNPTLNLPFTLLRLGLPGGPVGAITDASLGAVVGYTQSVFITSTTVRLYSTTLSVTAPASITSSAPMTWAAGDTVEGGFWADPA